MPTEKRPDWLVPQENGVIGEARARSFLLDRFWILERSVDIEGVDFFIQRRLIGRSLQDRSAPPLGVVQAKFLKRFWNCDLVNCGRNNRVRLTERKD